MFSSQPAEISLDAPCRALAAVRADKIESRFLVGSCSLLRPRQQPPPTTRRSASNPGSAADAAANHLYLVRFHSEVNELGLEAKVPHDTGPVCKIVASPNDPSIVLTVPSGGTAATLWRIPRFLFDDNPVGRGGGAVDDDDSVSVSSYASSAPSQMEALTRLESSAGGSGSSSEIVDAAWRDPAEGGGAASFLEEPGSSSLSASSSDGGDVVTLERNGTVTRWDATAGVASSTRQAAGRDATSSSRSGFPPRLALDPHSSNGCALAVSRGHAVHIVDWRAETSVPTGTVDQFRAHPRSVVTSLDYNPNKPHVLATSGQDGLVKVRLKCHFIDGFAIVSVV
jgi:WD40 repeat protein